MITFQRLSILPEKQLLKHAVTISFLLLNFYLAGCDGGLTPPDIETEPIGVIEGIVTYSGEWPPADSLNNLRFVPLRSIPQTPQDIFSDIDNLVFSEKLDYYVERDTFTVEKVPNGVYVYNAVAQNFSKSILDWKPVGVYEENDGIIFMNDDTISITIHVDFDNPPPFPPE